MEKQKSYKLFYFIFIPYVLVNLFAGVFKRGNQEPEFLKQIRNEEQIEFYKCIGNYGPDQCLRDGYIPKKNWIFGYQMNLFSEEYMYFANPEKNKSDYGQYYINADQLIIEVYKENNDDYIYDIHFYPKNSQIKLICKEENRLWGDLYYQDLHKEELPAIFNSDKGSIDEDWADYEFLESEKNKFFQNICSGIFLSGNFIDLKRLNHNFRNNFNVFNQLGIR